MNEDIWGLMRLPIADDKFPLPAIRECLYDVIEMEFFRNNPAALGRKHSFIMSHPHCKTSHVVFPLGIKNKNIEDEALKMVAKDNGLLLTIRVFFDLPDVHIFEQNDVLLRAFFGNKACLSNADVQEAKGKRSFFTIYMYAPVSRTCTLQDMIEAICTLYFWRVDDIGVAFVTLDGKEIYVGKENGIPPAVTTVALCNYFKTNSIVYMEIDSPYVSDD